MALIHTLPSATYPELQTHPDPVEDEFAGQELVIAAGTYPPPEYELELGIDLNVMSSMSRFGDRYELLAHAMASYVFMDGVL